MKRHALVTGGAGFIGSHLVDLLLAEGFRVTVLDDFSVGLRENLMNAAATGKLRVVEASTTNPDAVAEAISGCDTVYHLAVQCVRRSLGRPIESHDVNATGTLIVLEASRQAAVQRFVYCSSSEVYGNASTDRLVEDQTLCNPMTVYGAAKLAGEHYAEAYLRTYGLQTTVVRPFNAYGPRAHQHGTRAEVLPRFVGRVLNGLPPIIFGDPTNGRDFTYVTEVAKGIYAVALADGLVGERVNLAYGRMLTVGELAQMVLNLLGRNDLSVEIHNARPGDVHQLHADTRKAEATLGYKALIPVEEGVRRYIDWVQKTYPDPRILLDPQILNWALTELSDRTGAKRTSQ